MVVTIFAVSSTHTFSRHAQKRPILGVRWAASVGIGGREHRDNAEGTIEFISGTGTAFSASTAAWSAAGPNVVGNCGCLRWHIGGQPMVFLGSMADTSVGIPRTSHDGVTICDHRDMCSSSGVVDSNDRSSGGIDFSIGCGDMGLCFR